MSSSAPAGFDLTKTDPDVTDVLTLLDRQRRSARWVELDKVLKSLRTMARFSLRNAVGVSTTKIGRFRRGERATGIEPAPSVWKTETLPLSYARGYPAADATGSASQGTESKARRATPGEPFHDQGDHADQSPTGAPAPTRAQPGRPRRPGDHPDQGDHPIKPR
jgi:hypothetical protein